MSFLDRPWAVRRVDVVESRLVPAHADDHDPVEGRVGLAVASAEEPVSVRDPGRGGESDRRRRASRMPRRTGPAFGIVAGDDHHLGC